MKLTKKWLNDRDACSEGYDWYLEQGETDLVEILKRLKREDHFDWYNWLITKKFSKAQNVRYACYAAKQVLHIFEKQRPDDKRPRQAINAALRYAKNPTDKNRDAARAAWAAGAAGDAMRSKIMAHGIKMIKAKP